MIDQLSNSTAAVGLQRKLSMVFFGVGGAGAHVVDYLSTVGFPEVKFVAVDTDPHALTLCRVADKYQVGAQLTRGLGVGGDPDLGLAAAEKDRAELGRLCQGADMVWLAAGLGRGTGTGVSPVLARAARESGALTLAFAILPFDCEGQRRQQQAQRGFQMLKTAADGVICLPNQRLSKLVDEKTSLVETFRVSHELLAQGMKGIWRLLTQPGLIQADFAHLAAVLRGRHAESSFAMAEASGDHRAREVVEKIMASPLLNEGQLLSQAEAVLVSIAGGPDLNLAEVNRVMETINRQCENAQITLGATIDETLGDRLEVTLIASNRNNDPEKETNRVNEAEARSQVPDRLAESFNWASSHSNLATDNSRPAPRLLPPPPELTPEQTDELIKHKTTSNPRLRKAIPRMRQGQLPLEIVSKGRFEKSEPTIHHGEDLDVPTFKRRGLVLN